MAFPGPFADNIYSLRVHETASGSAAFDDNKFEFFHPEKTDLQVHSQAMRIRATGGVIEFSFDGTNVHGTVLAGTEVIYEDRHESAIYLRGAGAVFFLEVW